MLLHDKCPQTNKYRHSTRDDALAAVKSIRKSYGPKLHPYLCVHCDAWHLGHDRIWKAGGIHNKRKITKLIAKDQRVRRKPRRSKPPTSNEYVKRRVRRRQELRHDDPLDDMLDF